MISVESGKKLRLNSVEKSLLTWSENQVLKSIIMNFAFLLESIMFNDNRFNGRIYSREMPYDWSWFFWSEVELRYQCRAEFYGFFLLTREIHLMATIAMLKFLLLNCRIISLGENRGGGFVTIISPNEERLCRFILKSELLWFHASFIWHQSLGSFNGYFKKMRTKSSIFVHWEKNVIKEIVLQEYVTKFVDISMQKW